MRPLIPGSIAAAFVCVTAFTAHAATQGNDRQWTYCANAGGQFAADVAIASCTNIIRSGRESPGSLALAYFGRGNGYGRQGNHARAIADYSEAIRLNPNLAQAYHNRGGAWRDLRNYRRAIADYSEAIRLRSHYALAWRHRAAMYARVNDPVREAADNREADRLDALGRPSN